MSTISANITAKETIKVNVAVGSRVTDLGSLFVDVCSYASFSAAIDAIGASEKTLLIPNEQAVSADKTVPSNITLQFLQGGSLNIADTKTVTINGQVEAGLYQIFSWAGTGRVVFGAGAVLEVYPEWFGALGDGIQDDTIPFQAALTAVAGTRNSTVYIPAGIYNITSTLTVSDKTRIVGSGGNWKSEIHFNPTVDNDALFENAAGATEDVVFEDFYIHFTNVNAKASGRAFMLNVNAGAYTWIRVMVQGFTGYAIYHDSAAYDKILDCRFLLNTSAGLPVAVVIYMPTYANAIIIEGNRFSLNDFCIKMANVISLRVNKNCFARNGSMNPTNAKSQISIVTGRCVHLSQNFYEGEEAIAGEAEVFLSTVKGCTIENEFFDGTYGGVQYTQIFIQSNTCKGLSIKNCAFYSPLQFFFLISGHVVETRDNYYQDDYGGVGEILLYSSLMAMINGASLVQTDMLPEFEWNPGNLTDGTGETSGVQAAVGAVVAGDSVEVYPPYSLQGMLCQGYVNADDNYQVRLQNETGGAIDLNNGTWHVKIIKRV